MVDYPLLCPTEDEKRKGKEDEGKQKGGKGGKGGKEGKEGKGESNRGIERKTK